MVHRTDQTPADPTPGPVPVRPSLRRRVALLTGGAVACTVLVLSLVLVVGTRRALVTGVDRQLLEESDVVTSFVRDAGPEEVADVLAEAEALGTDAEGLRELFGPGDGPPTSGPPDDPDEPGPARRPGARGGPFRGQGPATGGRRLLEVLGGASDRLGGATGVARLVDASGVEVLPPRDGAVRLPVDDGDLEAAAEGPGAAPRLRTVTVEDRAVRLLTVPVAEGFALQVARPLDEVRRGQARLLRTVLVVGAGGTLLAALAGLVVARRVVEPVARLRDGAAAVAATGDLDQHLDVRGDAELAELAATFNAMLDSLADARRTQRQLVADASHELRTPLTSLRTNIEVLELDTLAAEERAALLRDVREQLVELSGLVDGLVTLARGDAAPPGPHVAVRLDDLVEEVVGRAATNRRDVRFVLETEPTTVRGDADEVARAVANLVDNAVKHGGRASPVEVVVRDGAVAVRDHGPGIAAADRPFVFDRFYRAAEARSRPGSGLGLAIVAQTARSHDGTVELEHPDDGGLRVTLRLPMG